MMRNFWVIIGVMALLTFMAWRSQFNEIRYVALGDSYSVVWPQYLTSDLQNQGIKIKLTNLAGTGKATTEVISEQLPEMKKLSPAFITLSVGANDINRGYSQENFTKNLDIILDKLSGNKVLLITIPDFSKTPTGKTFGDPKFNSQQVIEFNQVIRKEGQKRNIPVVEIKETFLVGNDGLHPIVKEYQNWEQQISPVALDLLKR